jgi:flagellar basal-body rod protein FlgB
LQPEISEESNGIVSPDGNTVDRDAELADMAENRIMYDASVQLLNKKLGLMKYAVGSDR